jgi:hypothetical protein
MPPAGREDALARVEAEIADPDGVVDQAWIGRFVRARLVQRGEDPPVDADILVYPGWDEYLTPDDRRRISQGLAAALPAKRGRALHEALRTLTWLDGGEVLRGEGAGAFRDAVLAEWSQLEPSFRERLLRAHWTTLQHASFVPLLEKEVEVESRPKPWQHDDIGSLALLRYAELEPEDGRRRILADMRRDAPRFSRVALTSLSDDHLEEVDALFRAPAEVVRRREGFEKHAALAERYGSPAILPTVLALLEERRWACELLECLLGHVLKHDRAQGLGLVERAARTRGPEETGCYRRILLVLEPHWGPDARKLVESFSDDPDPDVRRVAERLLSR